MKKGRLSRSKQRWNSDQLTFYFDTSQEIQEHYGTESVQSMKTEEKSEITKEKKHKGMWLCLKERKTIQRLIEQRWSLSNIATHLGRGKTTIIVEVKKNQGRENYNAKKAHERAMDNVIKKNERLSQLSKNRGTYQGLSLTSRIENLEMQIEILTDSIREVQSELHKMHD